ncbi:uncharacterized protein LOC131227063 [Magnolia sinica]|uniref:uncharacterized protein LOC131227063 n=1 Tax=Magnolia sinica TaxID=86752 RepID=UPI00265B6B54|nr:uncharacterized protein LOC131227063 [Magnolia sinica]
MSMQDPSLWDRPLLQWRVMELKYELKRRNRPTNGLKEDLVRRLKEVLNEEQREKKEIGNEFTSSQPTANSDTVKEGCVEADDGDGSESEKSQLVGDDMNSANNDGNSRVVGLDKINGDQSMKSEKALVLDDDVSSVNNDNSGGLAGLDQVHGDQDVKLAYKFDPECSEVDNVVVVPVENSYSIDSQNDFCRNELKEADALVADESQLPISRTSYQVTETVSQVVNCPSTCPLSINQENELKSDLNTKSVHLVPASMNTEVLHLVSNDGGGINMSNVQVESGRQIATERVEVSHAVDVDVSDQNVGIGGGPSENFNGGGNFLGESVEEDVMEKQMIDAISNDEDTREKIDIPESLQVEEDDAFDAVADQYSVDDNCFSGKSESLDQHGQKRKIEDEPPSESKSLRRQRKRNGVNELKMIEFGQLSCVEAEAFKLAEVPGKSPTAAPAPNYPRPRDGPKLIPLPARSDSSLHGDILMERIVPPPQRSPTTSLRIDNFLRPFTLKAIQELLSKTGTVCSFWMDEIKTHCYVTYSSVEEAVATRDALYNSQWPMNGGRLLIVEFVDPGDVKVKVEGPQAPPSTVPALTSSRVRATPPPSKFQRLRQTLQPLGQQPLPPRQQQPPLPPRQQLPMPPRQQLPPPPPPRQQLPPPPKQPLSPPRQQLPPPPPLPLPPPYPHPSSVRERLLPPPPRNLNPPVTLDDLFRKTRTNPRIYYLPLSEEQVVAKLAATSASHNESVDIHSRQ